MSNIKDCPTFADQLKAIADDGYVWAENFPEVPDTVCRTSKDAWRMAEQLSPLSVSDWRRYSKERIKAPGLYWVKLSTGGVTSAVLEPNRVAYNPISLAFMDSSDIIMFHPVQEPDHTPA